MRNRYDMQLHLLDTQLTHMGELCETAIAKVTQALKEGNTEQAKIVIKEDEEIDQIEKDIERLCLKLLLQQQPVARDLRRISAALKMITDMERIGDQTSDIAEIIISSKWEKMDENLDKLTAMATGVSKMVRNSVTAYVEKDLELARTVMNDDDEIDDYFDEIRDQIIQLIREGDGRDGRKLFDFIMVTKYLERIGDHATNIAEWVEFSITGVHKDSSVMHQEGERNMIFCVEDDDNIRELVIYTLETTGLEARGFADGTAFMEALAFDTPELVLLDIMLPGEDGLEILKKLKNSSKTKDIPVIMVTAKGSEYDKVVGLDSGADDYVTKPFGMMELISRIKAVLRRSGKQQDKTKLSVGGICLDTKKHEVKVDGESVVLTLKEFELLEKLMRNQGIVLTRDQLLTEIWGYDFDGETRTVDVHIRTLRQKLGEQGSLVKTVRGVGYRIGGEA